MRTFVTLARVRGEDAWEMVFGPGTPADVQNAEFKAIKVAGVHPRYDRVELWGRDGDRREYHPKAPPEAPTEEAKEPPAPFLPVGDSLTTPPAVAVVTSEPAPVAPPEPAPGEAPADVISDDDGTRDPAEDFAATGASARVEVVRRGRGRPKKVAAPDSSSPAA